MLSLDIVYDFQALLVGKVELDQVNLVKDVEGNLVPGDRVRKTGERTVCDREK